MPNWCHTTYIVEGSEKSLNELYQTIDGLYKLGKPFMESDFGSGWLGCLVAKLGFDPMDKDRRCRGEIIDYSMTDRVLSSGETAHAIVISMETAWCEQEGVRRSIEERFPDLKVFYSDEEPGCGNYSTNDVDRKYFGADFILELGDGTLGDMHEEYDSILELREAIADFTHVDRENIPDDIDQIYVWVNDWVNSDDDRYGFVAEVERYVDD